MGKICDVCGKPSGMYPLCRDCFKLRDEGKIVKDESLKKWVLVGDSEKVENSTSEQIEKLNNTQCLICGKQIEKGLFCYDCYKQKEAYKYETLNKRTKQEAMDHYFNQRNCMYKIKNPKYMESGAIRMVAIAEEVQIYKDNYLQNRVIKDIKSLMERKFGKKNSQSNLDSKNEEKKEKPSKNSFDDVDYRKQWAATHQCDDGHYVRSYSEMLIDNYLYNNKIVHAYEKSVFMRSDPEAVVLSDFYVPDGNVYIEFWGLNDDQKYLARKEKKLKMYNDNNLNLISLEESDVKRLNDIMPRKLFEFTNK